MCLFGLAFILGNAEALGRDGLSFDLVFGPFPLRVQGTGSPRPTAITLSFGEPDTPSWWEVGTITWLVQPALSHFNYTTGRSMQLAAFSPRAAMVLPSIQRQDWRMGSSAFLFLISWVLLFKDHILSKHFTLAAILHIIYLVIC